MLRPYIIRYLNYEVSSIQDIIGPGDNLEIVIWDRTNSCPEIKNPDRRGWEHFAHWLEYC